jgi:hypothetical protein
MAIGAGGLISDLWFPNLDDKMARHITPNPSPLAQQGGPAQPGQVDSLGNPSPPPPPPGANLPPSASTQPDPVVAANTAKLLDNSYASDAMKYIRRDEMGQGINLGLDRIAAGFGTAQQQASKQAGIARGQGVGGGLADLTGIQKMQDTTIQDNEHSRFMANAAVFAQTLRGQGINVTDAQATEIMNNPGLLERFGAAAGGNATLTGTTKDADEATASFKAAHPNATPQEIADYRASVISMATGGGNIEDQQYRAYVMAEKAAGRIPDDILTWKSSHEAASKEANATALNTANAKKALPGVNVAVGNMTRIADSVLDREDVLKGIFENDPTGSKRRWIVSVVSAKPEDANRVAVNAMQSGGLSEAEVKLLQDVAQLHNMNYRGAFAGEGGVKGIRSQVEAERVSRAADQLTNFTDLKSYLKNLRVLKGTYGSAQANAAGEAQAYDQIPENLRHKLDPSFYEGGPNAAKELPDWAKLKTVKSRADWEALPKGQAYRAPDSEHGSRILIKGYENDIVKEDEDG